MIFAQKSDKLLAMISVTRLGDFLLLLVLLTNFVKKVAKRFYDFLGYFKIHYYLSEN